MMTTVTKVHTECFKNTKVKTFSSNSNVQLGKCKGKKDEQKKKLIKTYKIHETSKFLHYIYKLFRRKRSQR